MIKTEYHQNTVISNVIKINPIWVSCINLTSFDGLHIGCKLASETELYNLRLLFKIVGHTLKKGA